MGKSSGAKQRIVDYFMSIHFGIAAEVDALTALYVNEKQAWDGRQEEFGSIQISKPDLFGGPKREGGLNGVATFLPGNPTQVIPEALAAKVGKTSATMPAYRGISSVWFHGSDAAPPELGAVGMYVMASIGSPNFGSGIQSGFQWTSNNPVVAQSVWARVERAPKGLNPARAMIGADANPAHMIYECLTNTDWGMGASPSSIDIDSFNTAAQTLYDEGFALSMIWTRQTRIEDFVTEVIDHIEASYFVHPRTGLITLRLIRDDYDPNLLPIITPNNADLQDYQRKYPGEIINEIIVTWTNPENEQEETVTVQNLAAIARQGGQINSDGRNYYGVRNKQLAGKLAERDLRTVSSPLASAKVRLLREFWDLVPGDVVRVQWPGEAGEPDIEFIGRVGPIDYGKVGSGYIETSLIEDVFSLPRPIAVVPPSTAWENPAQAPAPMAVAQVFTLPYYLATGTEFLATAQNITFPEVVAGVLAASPHADTRAFELLTQRVNPAGATVYESIGTKTPVGRTTLINSIAAEATTTLPPANLQASATRPLPNGLLIIGDTESTQEIALVTGLSGSNYVLRRGVLDTIPRAWPSGTPVWFLNPGLRIADEQIIRAAGEVVTYKLLTTTSLGTLDEASAPAVPQSLTARPHRPLRPANVRVNGQQFGDVAIGASTTITVQWATRNRLFEDGVILAYDATSVSPEYRQRTIVRVFNDATNILLVEYNHLWTETELVLQRSWFDRYAAIRIEVLSERDGLVSHQSTTRRVTGLANNPVAPLPPSPPDAGDPPAQAAAPGSGVFSLTSTTVTSPSGNVAPVLVVSGTQDDADADGLVIRYRASTGGDWRFMPTLTLNGLPVSVDILAVAANTSYEVEIAYLYDGGVPSQWRSIGPAVTSEAETPWTSIPEGGGRPQDNADVTAGAVPLLVLPPTTIIKADHTGTVLAGQLPRTLQINVFRGGDNVTAITPLTMTLAPAGGLTATLNSAGILNITGITASLVNVTIDASLAGLAPMTFAVKREDAPPPVSGSSGGSSASTSTLASFSGTAFVAVATLTVTTGVAGTVSLSAPLDVSTVDPGGGFNVIGKFQRLSGGSWLDVGSEATTALPITDGEPGTVNVSATANSLGSGVSVQVRLVMRTTTTGRTVTPAGTFSAVGS